MENLGKTSQEELERTSEEKFIHSSHDSAFIRPTFPLGRLTRLAIKNKQQ